MKDNDFIYLKMKWKKIERIAFALDLAFLFTFIVLSIVKQLTNFNSITYFILVVIFAAIMIADLVVLFISWHKISRLTRLIEFNEKNDTDNDRKI